MSDTAQPLSIPARAVIAPAPTWHARARGALTRAFRRSNIELILLFSLFVLAGLLNLVPMTGHVILNLFTIPAVVSAYLFGRRHAILTAFGSILLVTLVGFSNPGVLASQLPLHPTVARIIELVCWGAPLMLAASLVGTIYEHRAAQMNELRETYHGVVVILRHFVANDSYTENHCYRVSHYAVRIAAEMGLSSAEVEDLRAAALLHDIGKLKVSRDLLHKAARLTEDEYAEVKRHVEHGMSIMEPAGGALRRILPLVLSHHDRYDGQGYNPQQGETIPLGARILAVADAYDAMTSDRPYRKAVLPLEAKEVIEKGVGAEFDPAVVAAFVRLFRRGQLELTSVVV
jgi:putative nucleotidyltransferase with HDIG domain